MRKLPTEPTIAVERREAPRYVIEAPVDLGAGDAGTLCNMTSSGVLLRTQRRFASGEQFRFCWSVTDAALGPLGVRCEATVVRVEEHNAEWRVAASIESVTFNPIEPGGFAGPASVRAPATQEGFQQGAAVWASDGLPAPFWHFNSLGK